MSARRHRAARLLALLLCFSPPTSTAWADYIPAYGDAPIYYFSTSGDDLKISLAEPSAPEKSPEIIVIPRSYVFFANIERPDSGAPLPQEFTTNDIKIALVEGTGEAWNTAVAARAKRDKISLRDAGEIMRPQRIIMQLHLRLRPDRTQSFAEWQRKYAVPLPQKLDGLTAHKDKAGGTFHYYFGESKDAFAVARCNGLEGKAGLSCEYKSDVSNAIYADITFADFRHYGGREFANKRIDFARSVACRFLPDC